MARRHWFAVSRRDHREVAGTTSVKMILRLFPTASIPGKFNSAGLMGAERATGNTPGGDREHGAFGQAQSDFIAVLNDPVTKALLRLGLRNKSGRRLRMDSARFARRHSMRKG
jgi:hypothetical protein